MSERGRLSTALALAATLNGVVHGTEAQAGTGGADVSTPTVENTSAVDNTHEAVHSVASPEVTTDEYFFVANSGSVGLSRIQDYELRGYTVVQWGTDEDGNTLYKAWHPPKPVERRTSNEYTYPELHAEYALGAPNRQSVQEMNGYAVDSQGFVTGTAEHARQEALQAKIDVLKEKQKRDQEVAALLEEAHEAGWSYQERIDAALETETGMLALEKHTMEAAQDADSREQILEDLADAIEWSNAGAQNAVDEDVATEHALNAMCLRRLANKVIEKYEV